MKNSSRTFDLGARDPDARWSSIYQPRRPVLAWMIGHAEALLVRGFSADRVATFFGAVDSVELKESMLGIVLHRLCRGDAATPLLHTLLDAREQHPSQLQRTA